MRFFLLKTNLKLVPCFPFYKENAVQMMDNFLNMRAKLIKIKRGLNKVLQKFYRRFFLLYTRYI